MSFLYHKLPYRISNNYGNQSHEIYLRAVYFAFKRHRKNKIDSIFFLNPYRKIMLSFNIYVVGTFYNNNNKNCTWTNINNLAFRS